MSSTGIKDVKTVETFNEANLKGSAKNPLWLPDYLALSLSGGVLDRVRVAR